MNWIEQGIAYLVAFLLLVLSIRLIHKEKYPLFALTLLLAFVAFFSAQSWFQGLVKTEIISRAFTTLEAYGKKLDDFQLTTSKMKTELADQQTQIEKQQKELKDQQEKIKAAQIEISLQQGNIATQFTQISSLQSELATAQTGIKTQQAKIEDVEFLVENLFSKMVFENIPTSDTNRVASVKLTNGATRIAIKLGYAPILQSLQASVTSGDGFNIPQVVPSPILTHKNVLNFRLYGYDLSKTTFKLQYVKDTRETNLIRNLSFRGEKLLADQTFVEFQDD